MKPAYLVGAVVVLVIAAGGYWMMQATSSQGEAAPSQSAETSAPGTVESSGSLAALVAKGGSWKCDVSHTSASDTVKGVVYVSNGKVRGDFDAAMPNVGVVQSHMIADGSTVYVWSSAMPAGMKMKQTPPTDSGTQSADHQDFYNQSYDYKCSAWTTDSAQFSVPTDVTFNDMSALLPGKAAGSPQGSPSSAPAGMSCAMCDQAPTAEAKAACKSALKCK